MKLIEILQKLQINDKDLNWEKCVDGADIFSHFSLDEWHKIVCDINTEKEWMKFVLQCQGHVFPYIVSRRHENVSIGFFFLLREEGKGIVVSIHGGGWLKSVEATLLYYRSICELIDILLTNRIKVHTSCLRNNKTASRFIRSIGFINYKDTANKHLFYISSKRFYNCNIYKFIKKRKKQDITS